MKPLSISVVSDLHCHTSMPRDFNPAGMKPADVLVVAGDVSVSSLYDHYVSGIREAAKDKFKSMFFIRGNHDYYCTKQDKAYKPSVHENVVFTVAQSEGVGDDYKCRYVDFVCSPMWSPITHNKQLVLCCLNDYHFIPGFSVERCTELFWENLEWMEHMVHASKSDGHDVVIVTHHLPRHELISPKFRNSDVNDAFCVMDPEAEARLIALEPKLWIHGHSHDFMDVTLDGVRYVRNPLGYERSFSRENTGYRPDFIVEV